MRWTKAQTSNLTASFSTNTGQMLWLTDQFSSTPMETCNRSTTGPQQPVDPVAVTHSETLQPSDLTMCLESAISD